MIDVVVFLVGRDEIVLFVSVDCGVVWCRVEVILVVGVVLR